MLTIRLPPGADAASRYAMDVLLGTEKDIVIIIEINDRPQDGNDPAAIAYRDADGKGGPARSLAEQYL